MDSSRKENDEDDRKEEEGHQRCDMLFRTQVSKIAATKGRAILEGVGFPAEVRDTCFANHPSDVEEAVQSGLIKWRGSRGSSATWKELLNAMKYAEIGVQHIRKLEEELLKGSADGEVSVSENSHSIQEQHQSSPKCSSSPGSQAEPYDFEKSLEIALQQKGVEVDILKCVTLGPPAVGKTQLRRALTGNYEKVKESTPVSTGAEVIIEKYMDSEAKWQRFDLLDGQKALVTSVRERDFADSPHMETRSQRRNHHKKQMSKDIRLDALRKKLSESRDRIMKQLQQTDGAGRKSLHKARIIHLIDSGGQPSFFDVHSTLATSRAAYLQVFNLAEALDSKPEMTYRRQGFDTKALDSRFRNVDFVARTFATLHDCKKKFMKMDERIRKAISGHKSNDLPIFLIGTHMDKAKSSEDSDKLARDVDSTIKKECKEFPIWNEVVPNGDLIVHPVSCLVEGKAGIAALRQRISRCRGGYPVRLPLSWFLVELLFWDEKAAGDGCMKYSELRDICIQDNLLQTEDEFFTMVKLFHLLGLFSCPDLDREVEHDELDDFPVFTNPNFLFGEVSKILDIPFRDGLSGSLKYLQDTGMLRQGALEDLKIPESAGTFSDFHEWLLERLILWGLAAAVKKRREEGMVQVLRRGQELFIPSVLPPRPSARDKDPDVCSLLVAFQDEDNSQSYHIPQGIFSHFIVRLIQDKGYLVAPGVYRDLVSFKNVCRERVTYTVNVWEEMDHLAFSLVPESATKRTSLASYDAIRKELLQVLRAAWKHIYYGTPTLVVGFRCSCEGGGSSRDHIAEYRNKFKDISCCSKLRPGKCMPASMNQMKWFGISKGKAVAGAGKESLPCSSTEALQPAPANSSLPHTQPPFLHRNSTPMAVPTKEKRSRKRPSQSCNDPSQGTSGEHVSASTSSTGVSGRTSSTGQVAVDQHCTNKAAMSAEKEKLPRSSTKLLHPMTMNSSHSHSHTSQPPPLKRAKTEVAGKQSSTKKGTKKRSSSLSAADASGTQLLTKWCKPTSSLQRGDTQQLHGDSQIGGSQAAGYPLPLHSTHSSSSSSGVYSGGSEEMPSAPLSQPDGSPSDTDVPPPPKRSKATHSSSSSGDISGGYEVPLSQPTTGQVSGETRGATPVEGHAAQGAPVRFAILTANPREQNVVRYFLKLGAGAVCNIAKQCTWDQDALLSKLVSVRSLPKTPDYDLFELTDKGNPKKMVAGVHMKQPQMGATMDGAATETTLQLLDEAKERGWSLEVIFAVGCCGVSLEDPTKGDSLRGTVLLSSKLEDYLAKGKARDTGFELHPQFYQLKPKWPSYLSEIAITRPLSSSGMFRNIPVEEVHKIGSGPLVIKSTEFGDKIRAGISIVGLEMEGSGIARALSYSSRRLNLPELAVVKAVSDCGGEDKNQPAKTSFFGTDHEDVSDDARQEVATFHAIALVMRCVAVKILNCDICPS